MLAKQSPDIFIEGCFVDGHDFSGGHAIAGFYGAPQLLKGISSFMGNRLLKRKRPRRLPSSPIPVPFAQPRR